MSFKVLNNNNMSIFEDLMNREISVRGCSDPLFLQRNIVGSKYLIEKYELQSLLKGHTGCVNTVLFSEDGTRIFTGSDDTNVNIYLTETCKKIVTLPTIHTNNIFYAKDLPGTDMTIMVTCAADGRVVLTNLLTRDAKRIYRHRGRAHRIGLVPGEGNQFYSCGEDGVCCLFDLRQSTKRKVSSTEEEDGGGDEFIRLCSDEEESTFEPVLKTHFYNNRNKKCSIYTVGVNPFRPHQLALAGSSSHVALYDSRKINTPYAYLCPEKLGSSTAHVTGLKYDHCGEMLIASYNDENIYSFYVNDHSIPTRRSQSMSNSSRRSHSNEGGSSVGTVDTGGSNTQQRSRSNTQQSCDLMPSSGSSNCNEGGYYRSYSGHRNNNTVKQVAYLGARSEFVVSGSDCGHIFIWDVHSSQPIQMLHGDRAGAINCLAAHPHLPILATSGLEDDAKVWAPTGEYSPIADGTPKKKKVDSVIERNQERTPPPTYLYSNSIIDMLTSLLNQDPTALQNLSDDDDNVGDDDDDDDDIIDTPGTSGATPATSSQQSTISPSSNRVPTRTNTTRIPWSLMRLLPVILGRRRRSRSSVQESTSDNEYDVEEEDVNDDREDAEAEDDVNAGEVDEEDEEDDEDEDDEFVECHDCKEPARSDAMALQQALEDEEDDEGDADEDDEDEDDEDELCRVLQQYRACNGTEDEEDHEEDDDEDHGEGHEEDEEGGDVWMDCVDDDEDDDENDDEDDKEDDEEEEPFDRYQEKVCDQVVGI